MYPTLNDPKGVWRPASGSTAGTAQGWAFNSAGKVSHPVVATTTVQTESLRTEWNSTNVANHVGGIVSTTQMCWRGNATRLGGFMLSARFSISANPAKGRAFVGVSASSTNVCLVDPSTVANSLGVGFDSGDPTGGFWYLITRDATTGQKIIFDGTQGGGGQALRNTAAVYDFIILAKPNATSIYVRLENLSTGETIYNGFLSLPTPIPTTNVLFYVHASAGIGSPAMGAAQFDLYRLDVNSVDDGVYAPSGTQPLLQLVANGTISAGVAVQVSQGRIQTATTAQRTQKFLGVAVELASSTGQTIGVLATGLLDPAIRNVGAGLACAVGVDVNGNLVRSTNAACVSAPNWVGDCDTNGNIIVNPRRADFYDVRDFGAIPDFDYSKPGVATDNLDAFNACLLASKPLPTAPGLTERQGVVVYCPGGYYLSNTLHITHCLVLQGAGNGDETRVPGTLLAFPKDCNGKDCNGIQLHSSIEIPNPGYNSAGSTIRDMVLWCKDQFVGGHDNNWPDLTATGSGIYSSCLFYVQDVTIVGFGGDGISIVANAGPRVPPNNDLEFPGNADDSAVTRVRVGWCGRHGIFICGADANIIKVSDSSFAVCWGWGVYDVGGGSHFIGIDCSGNGGNFQTTGTIANGSTDLYVPNPALPGLTSPWIVGQAINIAGLTGDDGVSGAPPGTRIIKTIDISTDPAHITIDLAADFPATNAVVKGGNQIDKRVNHDFKVGDPVRPFSTVSIFVGCYSEVGLNDINAPSMVLGGYLSESSMYSTSAFLLNNGNIQNASLVYDNSRGPVRMAMTIGEPTNNMRAWSVQSFDTGNPYLAFDYRSDLKSWVFSKYPNTFVMGLPNPQAGLRSDGVLFRPGIYLQADGSSSGYVLQRAGLAAPSTGTWQQGDIVWNSAATPDGGISPFAGWICVASGSPGTWKTFGAISA